MRELTKVERQKMTYQLNHGEFIKGEWLKQVKDDNFLEVSYTGNNRILIVKGCNIVKTEGAKNE